MNKKISLITISLISLLLLTTLTGCGKKEEVSTSTQTNENKQVSDKGKILSTGNNEFDNSKVKKYYFDKLGKGDYYIKMKASFEGEVCTIESSKKGDAIVSNIIEQNMTTLLKDNKTYTIDHNNKSIYVISNEVQSTDFMPTEEDFINDPEKMVIVSGTEVIEGTTYEYEEMDNTRFYFNSNDLKYIKADSELIEILEVSSKPKDSLFDIPSDYTKMDI